MSQFFIEHVRPRSGLALSLAIMVTTLAVAGVSAETWGRKWLAPPISAPSQNDGSYYMFMQIPLEASTAAWSIGPISYFPWSEYVDDEPALAEADARLVFKDDTGAVTHSRLVARSWICNGHCEETDSASAEIPAQLSAVLAELYSINEAGDPLLLKASRQRSPSAPEVEILSPAPGETIEDGTVIEWRATDADGDELTYDLLYRPSVGPYQQVPLEVNITETRHVFERYSLPADQNAEIAVVANDGFNNVEATVNVVLEGNLAPELYVTSPTSGDSFRWGSNIILLAYAEDPEDGELPVSWTSDLDGPIFDENWSTGSVGRHVLTVSAVDSMGVASTQDIVVYIGVDAPSPAIYLPYAAQVQ